MNSALTFVKSAFDEIKKVQWPTLKESVSLTLYVLVISLIVGLFVALFDYLFTELLAKLITFG